MAKDKVWHQVTKEGFLQSQSQPFCFPSHNKPVGFICLSSLKKLLLNIYSYILSIFDSLFCHFLHKVHFICFPGVFEPPLPRFPLPFLISRLPWHIFPPKGEFSIQSYVSIIILVCDSELEMTFLDWHCTNFTGNLWIMITDDGGDWEFIKVWHTDNRAISASSRTSPWSGLE